MKGRNAFTSFLPLKKKGGLDSKRISEACLTEEQTKYVYDEVESVGELKVRETTMQCNSPPSNQVREEKDINLYEKVLLSVINTINKNRSQIEQWSILSDNIICVKSEDNSVMNGIDIK